MSYHPKVIEQVRQAPPGLGGELGRQAVRLGISAAQVASVTGASRQTAYNWLKGGDVMAPYRPAVSQLLEILIAAKTAEEAWRNACRQFNIPTR